MKFESTLGNQQKDKLTGPSLLSKSKNVGHLEAGYQPIRACLVDAELDILGYVYFPEPIPPSNGIREIVLKVQDIHNHGIEINYYGYEENKSAGSIQPEEQTFVISSLNGKDKFSLDFINCTGLIGVGVDKNSGKQISFLSHQDPKHFLPGKSFNSKFVEGIQQTLQELKQRSKVGSVDIVIFGGRILVEKKYLGQTEKEYRHSLEFLDKQVFDIFRFHPINISGPNLRANNNGGPIDVYFDTGNRRLYIVKPMHGRKSMANESFIVPRYGEKMRGWLNRKPKE